MPLHLLLSCEHGGNRIPAAYRGLFRGAQRMLQSHRGWDPGSLDVARALARETGAPLLASTTSRLLVDLNRSPHNPRVFSRFTRVLTRSERQTLLERHHRPHRERLRTEAEAAAGPVLHVAVHSFVPRLGRSKRNFDLGLLYDPQRGPERELARQWQKALVERGWSVRRNAPYRGVTDGLPTWLRTLFEPERYLGLELELNQRAFASPKRTAALQRDLTETLRALLGAPVPASHGTRPPALARREANRHRKRPAKTGRTTRPLRRRSPLDSTWGR